MAPEERLHGYSYDSRPVPMGPTLRQAAEEGDMEKLTNVLAFNPDMVYSITLDKQNTALHIAASNGHYRFVHHFLISVGVDAQLVISKNLDEETPLQLAVREGHGEVVEHLIKYQVWASNIKNIKIPNPYMHEALRASVEEGNIHKMLELTVDQGISMFFTVTPEYLNNVLHIAALKGDVQFVHHVLLYVTSYPRFVLTQNIDGYTPLNIAIREGHQDVVDKLLQYMEWARKIQPKLKVQKLYMDTTLCAAAEQRNIPKMIELTSDNMSMLYTVTLKEYNTILHIASSIGDFQFVHHVLFYISLHAEFIMTQNVNRETALHLAIKKDHRDVADVLIQYVKWSSKTLPNLKATMIKVDKYGNSVMHEAVLNLMSDIALQLLDVDPSCAHRLNSAMQSPLYISINSGLDHVVNKIAKQGLSAASVTTHGTALHQSVLGDNIRALEILLDQYRELLDVRDSQGNNALHYASMTNNRRMVSILLCNNLSLAYHQNNRGHTSLHVATRHGSFRVIRELLKQCPDLSEVLDKAGQNIFHVAVLADRPRILSWFLRYVLHAEMVNQQDLNGDTPLHLAAKNVFIQPARLLLKDPRVNRNIVNRDWYTALDISREKALIRSELNAYQLNIWKEMFKRQEIMSEPPHNDSIWQRPMGGRVGPPSDDEVRIYVYIVVAAFITMATFRATFTMPGRYDPRSGFAIAGHHWAFKLSVLCNTTSTCSSALVVLLLIAQWHSATWIVLDALVWANRFIILALFTMVVSMLMAIYLTVLPSS